MPEVNSAPEALPRRMVAEAVGTGPFVAGSGSRRGQLSQGNTGLQLVVSSSPSR